MNQSRHAPVAGFLFLFFFSIFAGLSSMVIGGELHVGQKVVYPGGADQPPKEKDVGVSFKANAVSGNIISTEDPSEPSDEEPDFEGLIKDGRTDIILKKTAGKADATGLAYRAIALSIVGRKKEAEATARKAFQREDLPEDVRVKLEETFQGNSQGSLPPIASETGR